MAICLVLTVLVFLLDSVVVAEVTSVKVKKGDSLTLETDVTKQQDDKMLWYFNDTLIALINGDASTSCLYDGEGERFRDGLEVHYESGSLTITNITTEHTGQYETKFIRSKSSGTSQSLNRKPKCDSTKVIRKMNNMGDTIKTYVISVSVPLSVKTDEELGIFDKEHNRTGLCVGVLLVIAVAVAVAVGIFFYRRRFENADTDKKKLQHLLNV